MIANTECPKENPGNTLKRVLFHCINGLIVEVTSTKPPGGKIPDWPIVHQLSRDRLRYRETLSRIRNSILGFRRQEETKGEK
jgi:hypothetical protein